MAIIPIFFSYPPSSNFSSYEFFLLFGYYVHSFKLQPETSVVDVRKAILTGKIARWWSFSSGNKHVEMPAPQLLCVVAKRSWSSGHMAGKEVITVHCYGFMSLLSELLRCRLSGFLPAAYAIYLSSFSTQLCLHQLLHPLPGTTTCCMALLSQRPHPHIDVCMQFPSLEEHNLLQRPALIWLSPWL